MPDQARHNVLDALLTRHPREIGETYTEHAGHAVHIGLRLIAAGLACLVHALLPGLFVRTATQTVDDIQSRIAARSCRERKESDRFSAEPVAPPR